MNWKLFWSTFTLLFMAELGDKTQLAVVCQSADCNKPRVVFIAASLALVVVTLIGTVAGQTVARFVPTEYVKRGAAGLFVLLGVLMWFDKI